MVSSGSVQLVVAVDGWQLAGTPVDSKVVAVKLWTVTSCGG